MIRRFLAVTVASVALCTATAAAASAEKINLEMNQNAAFSALGHWCGGIKEKVYETGFASNGYPQGNIFMETTCGGSGRGGGGHTTYTGTASVVWTWLGETWKWGPMSGTLEAKPAEDSFGDKLYSVTPCATGYHVGTCSYLEAVTSTPPYQPPAPPGNFHASAYSQESGETEYLGIEATWSQDPERLALLTKQTLRFEPLEGKGSVLEEEVRPYFSEGRMWPVEPNELYKVSVTESDNEGTSPPATLEIKTPNSDGEAERPPGKPECKQDYGTIALKPGLGAKAAVQMVTVTGTLAECSGDAESATYTTKFKTSGRISCAVLTGEEQVAPSTSTLTIHWTPAEEGTSTGTITFPLGEGTLAGLSGSLSGGRFKEATPIATVYTGEAFTGGSSCGVKQGKKPAKPVKSGTFSAPTLEFG